MKITEWFARAVAAWLMPEWENIFATYEWDYETWVLTNSEKNTKEIWLHDCFDPIPYINGAEDTLQYIQLRKNGKDLYSLEWRKPTEQDVSKMCWFYDADSIGITLSTLAVCDFQRRQYDEDYFFLLADHGRLAPTEADFKRIYGE